MKTLNPLTDLSPSEEEDLLRVITRFGRVGDHALMTGKILHFGREHHVRDMLIGPSGQVLGLKSEHHKMVQRESRKARQEIEKRSMSIFLALEGLELSVIDSRD